MNQSSLIKTHPLLKISEDTIYSNYQTLKKSKLKEPSTQPITEQ